MTTDAYIAIRKTKDESKEWADTSTVSNDLDDCAANARHMDMKVPEWASANPVQRIEKCRIDSWPIEA